MKTNYTDINAAAMNKWVADGWEQGQPLDHETYLQAQQGHWQVLLTPQIPVPANWFAPFLRNNRLAGTDLLGLASGGGQQMPIFQALGANATVLDYADSQLASEQQVAEREGYQINIVKADMSQRLPFADESFDLIFQPIANCYVADVQHIWEECYRILRPGGVLLVGMDNGLNYLFDVDDQTTELVVKHKLPYNPLKDPELMKSSIALDGSVQFSHSLEEQLGGQMKAGLTLTNLLEDRGPDDLLGKYIPQYLLTRAVKNQQESRQFNDCR